MKLHYSDVMMLATGRAISVGGEESATKAYRAMMGSHSNALTRFYLFNEVRRAVVSQHPWAGRQKVLDAYEGVLDELANFPCREGDHDHSECVARYKSLCDTHLLPLAPSEYVEVAPLDRKKVRRLLELMPAHLVSSVGREVSRMLGLVASLEAMVSGEGAAPRDIRPSVN